MDNDDQLLGQVLSRREALRLFGTLGVAGAALLVGCDVGSPPVQEAASPTSAPVTTLPPATEAALPPAPTVEAVASLNCVVRPELTEGPYFVDERLNRSDIRSDPANGVLREGTPLKIIVRVSQIDPTACTPLAGVTVDVWHCDGEGQYSDVQDRGFSTVGQKWLRGYQVTDANGTAEFTTIYPGWYPGRAVHIHFKLRTDPDSNAGQEFTSQWFFDESLTDVVHTAQPYASRGYRTLKNEGDNIYRGAGDQMILQASPEGDGYLAVFDIGMQFS
jgi:protocatechuate 3,4-dioxygenase beta subunit